VDLERTVVVPTEQVAAALRDWVAELSPTWLATTPPDSDWPVLGPKETVAQPLPM